MTWTPDEEGKVDEALAKLALTYRQPMDAPTLAAYAEVLCDLPVQDVLTACLNLSQTDEFMPSAAKVRKEAASWRAFRYERQHPFPEGMSRQASASIISQAIARMRRVVRGSK